MGISVSEQRCCWQEKHICYLVSSHHPCQPLPKACTMGRWDGGQSPWLWCGPCGVSNRSREEDHEQNGVWLYVSFSPCMHSSSVLIQMYQMYLNVYSTLKCSSAPQAHILLSLNLSLQWKPVMEAFQMEVQVDARRLSCHLHIPTVASWVEGSITNAQTAFREAAPCEKLQTNSSWSAFWKGKWMPRAVNNLHWLKMQNWVVWGFLSFPLALHLLICTGRSQLFMLSYS